ncbi:MAG: 50S ribosomal protein L29 [Bacteroidetes bacterium HGW-Bacteroidetes-4]|jgi:large subunit ribosomal protein L29|nr:MAG: 50S ribosomal protein L29 [Bacteroidetes bacterium HGW-Bacteroidetes-4]
MKASEIKELSTQELIERIDDYKKVLTRMRLNHAVSPLDNPNKLGATKKDIARLKTELRARDINENK